MADPVPENDLMVLLERIAAALEKIADNTSSPADPELTKKPPGAYHYRDPI